MSSDMLGKDALEGISSGPWKDFREKLSGPQGEKWWDDFKRFLRKEDSRSESFILKSISLEPLFLDPVDGMEVIADAKEVFAWIDSDFRNWGVDQKGQATGETPVRVCKMVEDATFKQMFVSLSSDTRKLCLTQSQIIGFVKKHRQWLRTDGYATFFLFKSHDQLFVALVAFRSDGALSVIVHQFGDPHVWGGGSRRRVVVPQLA